MKYLVGDIGNTLTKISLLNENFTIIKSFSIQTNELNKKKFQYSFFKKLLVKELNKKILFSSVVPKVFKDLKNNFKKKNFKFIEIKEININKVIKLKVDNIKQVGSDRIANAIGSFFVYKSNCLVIDFGTATTFDVVRKPGIYDGGVIAPGLKLSIFNLNKYTALLPIFKLNTRTKTYGKNTKDALNAGFFLGLSRIDK